MTKTIKGNCEHCGARLEFPADQIGDATDCRHCGQRTELTLATPAEKSTTSNKKRLLILLLITIAIGVVGLIGSNLAIQRAKRITGQDKKRTELPAEPRASFTASRFSVTSDRP
jgi:DNA-directed RNA polymerase subunit RPC12/RpoP